MTITDRLVLWTMTTVVLTAVTVGAAALIAGDDLRQPGPWVAVGVAGAIAIIGGYVGASAIGISIRDRWAALARQIQLLIVERKPYGRIPELPDPDLAISVRGINDLLERVQRDWDRLQSDAALGHSLIEQTPNGVLVVRGDGRIRYCNAAFLAMVPLGPSPYDRSYREMVTAPDIQAGIEARLRGEEVEEFTATAGRFDLLVRLVATDGGALVLLQDITRFRAAERARTDFVSNVSHELRTPIASILGYAEAILLDKHRLDAEFVPMADALYRNALRLRDIFEDLLELSRLEARRGRLPITRERLLPILERSVAPAADLASQRKQYFELICDDTLEGWTNPEALETIVANFASNACKYTKEGGRIIVRCGTDGRSVRIDVEDNGIGIAPEYHDRIFERFYRVDAGRSRSHGGTGLGLAIAKHYALASGCRLALQSAPEVGSTFSVILPESPP